MPFLIDKEFGSKSLLRALLKIILAVQVFTFSPTTVLAEHSCQQNECAWHDPFGDWCYPEWTVQCNGVCMCVCDTPNDCYWDLA